MEDKTINTNTIVTKQALQAESTWIAYYKPITNNNQSLTNNLTNNDRAVSLNAVLDALEMSYLKSEIDDLTYQRIKELPSVKSQEPKIVPIAEIKFDDGMLHEIVKEAVKNIEIEPKWIPVSEKLPENRNQEVLISLEWGIDIGRYSDGEWHSEWINHYNDGNVIAWMPLPTRYEPQERSEDEKVNQRR